MSVAAAPFAASIDVEAFLGMLDIEIYVIAALMALPLARVLSIWIKPKTIASIKHELMIFWMCFDRTYEIPKDMRVLNGDSLNGALD
ncbi:hypothetical protein [Dyella flagellata]|uniref:Uncharacterized protein n=2 Tax=Dyella flagellata TaxID=1867833 RepID=A0ABQ5XB27_9GAMM|nr:hypothetical protein [Dyella flagellata]GLQ88859.1 hypothetical protein GCM10007898_24300 [Dyella flagellata]